MSSWGSACRIHKASFTAMLPPRKCLPAKFQSAPTGILSTRLAPLFSPSSRESAVTFHRPTPRKGCTSPPPKYCFPVTARLISLSEKVARFTSTLWLPHRNSKDNPTRPIPPAVTPNRKRMPSPSVDDCGEADPGNANKRPIHNRPIWSRRRWPPGQPR